MAEQTTIDQLTKRLDELEKSKKASDTIIATLQKQNTEMKKVLGNLPEQEPAPQEPAKTPTETFSVDGTSYKFLVPRFRYKGNDVTAVDALSDTEMLAHLVKTKSGLIQEA